MSTSINEILIERLSWRYAVKKFDPEKKISEKDWECLEEVLRLTPSSYGLQPFQFILIQNPEIRKKLTPVSWGQTQIEDCSHLIVLAHLNSVSEIYVQNYIENISVTRGVKLNQLDNFKQNMINDLINGPRSELVPQWSSRQVYIAMGSFLTAAALMKIDVCPMEGIDPVRYAEILGFQGTQYNIIAVLAAGYRSNEDPLQYAKKVRLNKENLIRIIK